MIGVISISNSVLVVQCLQFNLSDHKDGGSNLSNSWARQQAEAIVAQLTLTEKISLLSTSQSPIPRFNLGEFHIGGEAAHGIVDRQKYQTTSFPIPLTLSQTWNPALMEKVGAVVSDEARALYNTTGRQAWLMPWAPTVDLERDPRWGRNEEGYGEDPYLTGQVSGGLIRGFQGSDHFLKMAAAPKHFFANNNEINRGSTSNTVIPTMKHEYYLKPFIFAFRDNHAQSMMTAYNGINGIPAMQSPEIQRLKDQWQMDGCVVTDGGALTLNLEDYHYYDQPAAAVADALKKGIDCFVDDKDKVETAARQALDQGLIDETAIDRAVTNTLKVRLALGQDGAATPYDRLNATDIGTADHDLLVQKTYAEGTVLLKNQGNLLPLDPQQDVLVTGPLADRFVRDWYATIPENRETVQAGISHLLGDHCRYVNSNDYAELTLAAAYPTSEKLNGHVFEIERWNQGLVFFRDQQSQRYLRLNEQGQLELGKTEVYDWVVREAFYLDGAGQFYALDHNFNASDINSMSAAGILKPAVGTVKIVESGLARVRALANQFPTVILVGGNHPLVNARETEDRSNLELPAEQVQLAQMLATTSAQVATLIVGGYPFLTDQLPTQALLFTGYAGQSLGTAMAKIIFGQLAPTGKLSQTWYGRNWHMPRLTDYDIEQTQRTYQYAPIEQIAYPFGFGLTYGQIQLKQVSSQRQGTDLTISLTLTNPDANAVTETPQVYLQASGIMGRANRKQLLAFQKTTLEAGATKQLDLTCDLNDFAWFDPQSQQFYFPEASYHLEVGFAATDVQYRLPLDLGAAKPEHRLTNLAAVNFDAYHNIEITSKKTQYQLLSLGQDGYVVYRDLELRRGHLALVLSAQASGTLKLTDLRTDQTLGILHFHDQEQEQTLRLLIPENKTVDLKIETAIPVILKSLSSENQ